MQEDSIRSDIELRPPVAIAVGAGFKREIASLTAMQNFLKEWPQAMRGGSYANAFRACEAARSGEIDLDKARQAFLVFARKAGIEWTGADPVAVLREAKIRRIRARESRAPNRHVPG
ncbi:DUF982 domain-containing protein [Mesorhizobium sp. CA18]|uniref:DUF982 domain-containing protein n=1 Tax=unclassified Mesorhizobium TaxID=325217 RepID=UPI001CC9BC0A|nr:MULTISPECIES: DUF982 domain-containing protein [unclassified Mesorhizobium]MBZ9736913.1 DUF982 domain-containing protein [Mesorhizobium sp. CA9]MBZ9827284.1 DUF982 domain-containing protein [Mesorhizobium sp. CA18]MBZ9832691.1 DUF982 domain-containing protein [Mesorhizobium sp. CA2]MBZ9838968.1 DUF982 domain-containing protein [Mesorhizobium sp. CA3]MBZ9879421.1 DUF982 domain-containing protein [Mesorhizobium sp. Ca11]